MMDDCRGNLIKIMNFSLNLVQNQLLLFPLLPNLPEVPAKNE